MKKFVFGFLSMLFAVLGAEPAQALTVQWDEPGSVVIRTSHDDASTNIAIDPTATSFELTESQMYYVCPAPGYQLVSTEVISGGNATFKVNNYGTGQFVSADNEWRSGYTVKINTRKLTANGSITINVINGAEKISGHLVNKADYNMSTSTPVVFKEGEQTVNLTDADDVLELSKASGVALQSLYSVKLNGVAQEPSSTFDKTQHNISIKNGDKVEIQVYDPDNMPEEFTATFKFKNGDDKALKSVYNVTATAGKSYAELVANGWSMTCEKNNRLRLQLNEDYDFNGITANGEPMELNLDMNQALHTVTANTEFVIDAKAKEYDPVTAQVYVTMPEGVTFYSVYSEQGDEDNKLTLTAAEDANNVKMGEIAVPNGTKSFTLSDINPKTGKIFFVVKPGYYVKQVACAKPETSGENDITTMGSWNAANGPFYMDIREINANTQAVIAYVGDEGVARIRAYNAQGDIISVEGLTDELKPGYTEFSVDPAYHDHFQIRGSAAGKALLVYLNGEKQTVDDNGLFQGIKLTQNSLIKVFEVDETETAIENHRVNFTVAAGLGATVKYDKLFSHEDLTQPLVSRGATLVELTPTKECIVKVNGKTLKPVDWRGTYAFTTEKVTTTVELSVKPLPVVSTKPAEGKAVKKFSTATISMGMIGENEVKVEENVAGTIMLTTPANEKIAATACEGTYGDREGIPFVISFPEQTAAGDYTLTIPAGIFYEAAYDWDTQTSSRVENGSVNEEIVVHFTVDPEASEFKNCVMTPANGSAIRHINNIKVKYPDVTDGFDGFMPSDAEITLTNGEKTYNGSASIDWNNAPYNAFNVTFVDADENDVDVTEAGEWTLSIAANLFHTADEEMPAITAKFTVDPNAPISWTADPENGSQQELPVTTQYNKYTMVTFTFDAKKVSYEAFKDANVDSDGNGQTTGETGSIGGIRVMYRGADVDCLEDIMTDEANGFMLYDDDYRGSNQVVFAFNNSVFEKPGVLTIECDENTFTVDGEGSPKIEYNVTFGELKEYNPVFTPASGSEVESLKEFTIEFPEATEGEFDEDNCYIVLQGAGWIYPTQNPTVTKVEGAEHATFKVTFDLINEDMNLKPGRYSIRVGEGTFSLDNDQQSPEFYGVWTLKRTTPVDKTWHAEPNRDMVNVGYGMFPAFAFSEMENISTNNACEEKIVVKFNDEVIEEEEEEEEAGADEKMAYNIRMEGSSFMFEITGGILNNKETEGKLTITIPEGYLTISGEPCEKIEYTWNLVKEKTYEVKVTPADKSVVNKLKEFCIEFIGAKNIEQNLPYGIDIRSNDYKVRGEVDHITFDTTEENAKAYIILKEALTVDGDYVLQIHPTTFYLDGCQTSPEIKANFTIDQVLGVEGIEAATKAGQMFDLSGRRVNKATKGLYIVNGKKVLLNK